MHASRYDLAAGRGSKAVAEAPEPIEVVVAEKATGLRSGKAPSGLEPLYEALQASA
jgi:hypothetical protein